MHGTTEEEVPSMKLQVETGVVLMDGFKAQRGVEQPLSSDRIPNKKPSEETGRMMSSNSINKRS